MKIQKYVEYLILEGNTPENYMASALNQIKSKIDPIFDEEQVKKLKDFKNFNLQLLNDPKLDQYAPLDRSIKYKFTDETDMVYILTFTINLKDAINPDPEQDYKAEDIKKIHVTFDKYENTSTGLNLVNQLLDRTVEQDRITPDYLIDLKLEIDGEKAADEDEFKIETTDEEPKQGQAQQSQMPKEESVEQTQNKNEEQ